jgi:hypothetical protein
MLTCVNMNMKKTWQGYDVRSCLRMVLNRWKEKKGPIPIYTPLGTYRKEASKEAFICELSKEVYWEPS